VIDDPRLDLILREVLALRVEVRALGGERVERDLVRLIVHNVRNHRFSSRELVEHATAHSIEMRAVIIAAVGSLSSRRLGRLLRRLEGREFEGYQIVAVGADRDGIVWGVRAAID
jgi:hypothetical protein